MYIWPKEIQQIIAEVLHAQNPITCLEKFKNYEREYPKVCVNLQTDVR